MMDLQHVISVSFTQALRETNRLYEDLLRNYNRLIRPSRNASEAVFIEFKFKLLQILDVVYYSRITIKWLGV